MGSWITLNMKTVLILLTIFIFKCHSKNKIYLIETDDKDEGDNSRKTRRIEAGSDYGNDDPSPYGEPEPYKAKVKPYDEEVTTTTKKKWTTTTAKWETTTTWKPKTTTTTWKEKITCVWSKWSSWSKPIKT